MEGPVLSQAHATLVENFPVPPEVLFDVLSDHEGMSDWLGVRVSVLRGPEDGGAGTVRRLRTPGGGIDEEVTYAVRPRRIAYRIVRGLPIVRFHRGEILIEPWGQTGSQLSWDIRMDSAVPGVARALTEIVGGQLRQAFSRLRRRLSEARSAAA